MGSLKNKLPILGVESPVRQVLKTKAYQAYAVFSGRSRTGWIGFQNVKLFLSGPLAIAW